jgi:hypothetical protein
MTLELSLPLLVDGFRYLFSQLFAFDQVFLFRLPFGLNAFGCHRNLA